MTNRERVMMGVMIAIIMAAGVIIYTVAKDDPDVEVAKGFSLPKSALSKMDCMPTNGIDGKGYIWCQHKENNQ